MIFINLENNPPPDEWIARADALTQSLIDARSKAARDAIIDGNTDMWSELKEHLSKLSDGKCWYTESKNDGAHDHVDHFRPKKEVIYENIKGDQGGYWWLAFEWTNYRFSGQAPNVRKRSYFHVNANKANNYGDAIEAEDIRMLDPTDINDPDLLAYNTDGTVVPKITNKTHREYIKAEYSIRRLNLYLESLVEGRRTIIRDASIIIKRVMKNLQLQEVNYDQTRQNNIKTDMKELWKMSCRSSIYSAAAKFCLKSTGEEWALEIVAKAA